jgi:hypothetical protein
MASGIVERYIRAMHERGPGVGRPLGLAQQGLEIQDWRPLGSGRFRRIDRSRHDAER